MNRTTTKEANGTKAGRPADTGSQATSDIRQELSSGFGSNVGGTDMGRREDLVIQYRLAYAAGDADATLRIRDLILHGFKTWKRILNGLDKWEAEFDSRYPLVMEGDDVTVGSRVGWKDDDGRIIYTTVGMIFKGTDLKAQDGKVLVKEMTPTDTIPADAVGTSGNYMVRFDWASGSASFVLNTSLIILPRGRFIKEGASAPSAVKVGAVVRYYYNPDGLGAVTVKGEVLQADDHDEILVTLPPSYTRGTATIYLKDIVEVTDETHADISGIAPRKDGADDADLGGTQGPPPASDIAPENRLALGGGKVI